MNRLTRLTFGAAALAALVWFGGCGDPSSPGDGGGGGLSSEPSISEPITTGAALLRATRIGGQILASTLAAVAPDEDVAYVGLPPGTKATAEVAVVRNPAHEGSLIVAVRNGGFDPVPLVARPEDLIQIQLLGAGGVNLGDLNLRVPSRKAPKVVRSTPPRGGSDVPINKHIVVVFSEPVDPGSLSPVTLRLRRGNTTVSGVVRLLDGSGLSAVFLPSAPLAARTNYTLDVTGVRDIEGDILGGLVQLAFRTGTSRTGLPSSVRMSVDTVNLSARTYQLSATVADTEQNILADQPITWESSDPSGLSVSQTGLITALADGYYIVSATSGGVAGATAVVVRSPFPLEAVSVTPRTASISAEDTLMLFSELRDANGQLLSYREVTWTTSDPAVATVSFEYDRKSGKYGGRVIARKAGEVTITATSEAKSGTATLTITPPRPVASLTLSPAAARLLTNVPLRLTADVRSASGAPITGRPIAWRSTSPAIATVDAGGVVTGVAPGTADIIGTIEGVSDTVTVTIDVIGQFTSVAAGWTHTCALDPAGKAYCWGTLVDAPSTFYFTSAFPVAVETDLRFKSLTAGTSHTCGLTTGGAAYCWGANAYGQLGSAPTSYVASPIAVQGGLAFVSLSAGRWHTCGLTADGAAYCWGINDHGQFGVGSLQPAVASSPVAVTGGLTFASLFGGRGTTCGIATTGAAYCWGANYSGQLGTGVTVLRGLTPGAVNIDRAFSDVAPGGHHDPTLGFTCGVAIGGAAYCWGSNFWGQLGDGTGNQTNRTSAVPVAVSGGLTFSSVTAGSDHACGLTTAGSAYCWGLGSSGSLGDGTSGVIPTVRFSPLPVAVSGGLVFTQLSAGGGHTCGMTTTRELYCWGANGSWQLGRGSSANGSVPVKVAGQP